MLQEFTDTAIDFAEDGAGGKPGDDQHPGGRGRAGHQAGPPDHPGSGHHAGLRHPHRAVRRPGPDPLPDRRRADGARLAAAPAAGRDRQPPQDHGVDRHRREAAAPGRPDQDPRRRQGHRPACQHPADHAWPVGRHADPRPRQHQGRPPGPGLRATRTWTQVPEHDQAAQRHLPRDRPDRVGQDDHALCRAQRAEPSRREDHHRRGPGRVLPARRQPVRGQGQDRDDVRTHHPGHAAAESRTSSWSAKSAIRRRPRPQSRRL